MKKILSILSSTLILFVALFSFNNVAKSAEFFSIGTGGPTGVYFQVGNAICKMVAKIQSKDHEFSVILILIYKNKLSTERSPATASAFGIWIHNFESSIKDII